MESVQQPAPNHRVVHLESRSAPDSEVTAQLRLSKAIADKLAHLEGARLAALDLGTACPTTEDDGSATLTILTSITASARVHERASASDQQEFINHIKAEVVAARAEATLLEEPPAARAIHLDAVDDLIPAAYDYRRVGADFPDRLIAAAAKRSSADALPTPDPQDDQLRAMAILSAAHS